MHRTLQEYSALADDIHKKMLCADLITAPAYLAELNAHAKLLIVVTCKITNIMNKFSARNTIDVPISNKCAILAAPGVHIDAVTVQDESDVPDSPMYWVKNAGKFATKINGVLLAGNIGNIYNSDSKYRYYAKCKVKGCAARRKSENKICKYYHPTDPVRHFSSSDWIYSPFNLKNVNMRHVGNGNTLHNDIRALNYNVHAKNEVVKYMQQTIHDILISLAISKLAV